MKVAQKILLLGLFTSLGFLSPQPAWASPTLEDCDRIYAKREKLDTSEDEKLLRETLACLQAAGARKPMPEDFAAENLEDERYDRIMIVLSALLQAKTGKTADDLSVLKNAIEKWKSVGGSEGVLSYWRGVHLSLECEYLDQGKPLPLVTVKNLKTLIGLFETASKNASSTHHAGPDRVLGILFGLESRSGKALPQMFGGDTRKAEGYLRKAYGASPDLSANALHFARILIKNGKKSEAQPILDRLKNRSESEWNPYASSLRFPRPETRDDIAWAKRL